MSEQAGKVKLFESQQVRAEWDAEHEKWWFSVLDIIAILTDQPDYTKVRNYWKWLKNKLIAEGSQLVSATNQLKLKAADGKRYKIGAPDKPAAEGPFTQKLRERFRAIVTSDNVPED